MFSAAGVPARTPAIGRSELATGGLLRDYHIARRNTYLFVTILLFQEVFWLVIHRLVTRKGWEFYRISDFNWITLGIMVAAATILSLVALICSKHVRAIPRIRIGPKILRLVFITAILGNLVVAGLLQDKSRYVSGSFIGVEGVIYGFARAFMLAAMILTIKNKFGGRPFKQIHWILALSISFATSIDGLAPALTLGCYVLIIFGPFRTKNILGGVFVATCLGVLLAFGISRKFTEIPAYVTPEFMAVWSISRMSISAEQAFTYLKGESILSDPSAYIDLIIRSISNRFSLIMGESYFTEYPRTVSEAFYYDMYANFEAGSSPGFFLGAVMHSIVSPVIVLGACFIFFQMFKGLKRKFSIIELYALTLLTKEAHANITEYFVVISPSLVVLALFVLASIAHSGEMNEGVTRPSRGGTRVSDATAGRS